MPLLVSMSTSYARYAEVSSRETRVVAHRSAYIPGARRTGTCRKRWVKGTEALFNNSTHSFLLPPLSRLNPLITNRRTLHKALRKMCDGRAADIVAVSRLHVVGADGARKSQVRVLPPQPTRKSLTEGWGSSSFLECAHRAGLRGRCFGGSGVMAHASGRSAPGQPRDHIFDVCL
jgi:hypothetical protein